MLRMLHFRNKTEEEKVTCIRKHGIRDADERRHEVRLCSYTEIGDGEIDACANHANDAGYDDADDAGDTEPGQAVERTRERADEGGDGEDAGVEHKAELAVGELGPVSQVGNWPKSFERSDSQSQVQSGQQAVGLPLQKSRIRLCRKRGLLGRWDRKGSCLRHPCYGLFDVRQPTQFGISHKNLVVRTLWMPQLELDQDPGREEPKRAEEDDDDDAWHQTHDGQ